MRSRRRIFGQAVGVALPAALVLFGVAEGVQYLRRKPALGFTAPNAPGAPLPPFELHPAPPPARPRVRVGTSAEVELRAGDRVALWTRISPMTPELPARLDAVTLGVRLKGPAGTADAACPLNEAGAAWTEPCGEAVCLRTAPACVLVAPAAGSYAVEANVEWGERGDAPAAAALEPFVARAPR